MTMKMQVGIESLKNYRRLDYELHYALAELVDNSIQAYEDHKRSIDKILKQKNKKFHIKIDYDKQSDCLTVVDNASGMNEEDLESAFDVGSSKKRKDVSKSLGEFNIGLKSSAMWLCDIWEIKTKKFDEEKEITVTVINEDIFNGNPNLDTSSKRVTSKGGYTILRFEGIVQKLNSATIKKAKTYLSSMYRKKLDRGYIIEWDSPLEYEQPKLHINPDTNRDWKVSFGPSILDDGRLVEGWIGVLAVGLKPGDIGYGNAAGYPNGGIAIARRERIINPHPEAWLPRTIFGQGSALVAQRVTGEITFDDAKVSHDKSTIDPNDLTLLATILGIFNSENEISRQASAIRVERKITKKDEENAKKDLKKRISESDLGKRQNSPIPPIDDIEAMIKKALKRGKNSEIYTIGKILVKLCLERSGEAEPYAAYEKTSDKEFKIVVNLDHPFIIQNDQIKLTDYFLQIIIEMATRFKLEGDNKILMSEYFAVKDLLMRYKVSRVKK